MNLTTTPQVATMTSLELVAFINADRRSRAEAAGAPFPSKGFAELAHKNFLAKVSEVLGERSAEFSADLSDSYGRRQPGYRFPKREACLMAMSYSYELQAKVFDRMTELEANQAKPAALTPAQMLLAQAQMLVDLEQRQIEQERITAEQEQRIKRIECKQQAFEEGASYYAVLAYAKLNSVNITATEANMLGRKAAALSREKGIAIDKVRDPRFGQINAYHESVLGEVFGAVLNGQD